MLAITGYTPTELIHAGASTIIWRGYRDEDHARVVLKSHPNEFPTALERAMLRHEHALLSELQGPGIVPVHPLSTSRGRVTLVMEDVGLSSLDSKVGAPLELGLVLRIVIGVATILRLAHKRGILHKDVKPHNILVGTAPLRVYLIDWGIASRISELPKNHDGSQPPEAGTLAYIAPEQTGMMNRPIDPRTDLYSLGVTFYELLTGALPFIADSPAELLRSHLTRLPRPPAEVSPQIPAQVSAIVMKLLAKNVEDRYTSARGLAQDLEECLAQWERLGQIASFPLGRQDCSGEFRLSQKLYGRESDVAAVLSAYQRVQQGSSELFVVTGYGGVGKTAIVQEARGPMRLRGARVATGKFDQVRDATPYSSLLQALRELTRQLMTEDAGAVASFRARLLEALGQNAAVLTELIPELERILGPSPPVPRLGPVEEENRWNLAMQRFVSAFARPERPLVLFLDDLQWADPASLKLIERLIAAPLQRHLLIIGACRDSESVHTDLLTRTLASIAEAGGAISTISLRPLTPADVNQMIADALHQTQEAVAALGAEIYHKTQGNPFFVGQLLTSLFQDALISFDEERGSFRWDLATIAGKAVTANVAEFMAERLQRLPPQTLSLLKLGACMGTQFDHDTLAKIARQSTAACADALTAALTEGILVPLHEDYRLLSDLWDAPGASSGSGDDESPIAARVTYRFLHDRVQEAAYSFLTAEETPRVHLEIGRLLRARHEGEVPDESVFSIVAHLNLGRALITSPEERLEAASHNLRAGRRALVSVAYAAARNYLSLGITYLPEDAWHTAYDLSFALHKEHAASAFLCHDFDRASALFDDLLAHTRERVLTAEVQITLAQLCTGASRFSDAVRIGRLALSALDAPLPETEEACQATFDAEARALRERIHGRSLEELLDAPPMVDPLAKARLHLLILIDTPAVATGCPKLSGLVSVRQVQLSLDHGPSELSASGAANCVLMMLRLFGRSPEVTLLSGLAAGLEARYPRPEYAAKLSFARAHEAALTMPAREAVAHYERAAAVSWQYGDLGIWQMATSIALSTRFIATDEELDSIKPRTAQLKTELQRARYEVPKMSLELMEQSIACLKGTTRDRRSLDDDGFDDRAFVARAKEMKAKLPLAVRWYYRLIVLCVHAEHEAAIPLLGEIDEWGPIFGQSLRAHCAFFLCLHTAALIDGADDDAARRYWAIFEANESLVAKQRTLCEEEWRCRHLLVLAERARLSGQDIEAQRCYSEAIELAQQDGMVRLFGLSNERYGRFSLKRGLDRLARICLSDAYQGFSSWGAVAKAEALVDEFPRYTMQPSSQPKSVEQQTTTKGSGTVVLQGVLFDLGEAMHAAHAISSEIMPARVVEHFLRASAATAVVRRAFVILMHGDELQIAGKLTTNPDMVQVAEGEPWPLTTEVCVSVVRYVARSHEPVILGNKNQSSQFAGDPYLREHNPRSLLCFPLLHQDRLLGVWYAESDAESELRRGSTELLQLLAGHAASALDNAHLYEQLKVASEELSDKNQRLSRELEERGRAESERSALQERVIQMQDDMLLELSTPLIPISQHVVVVPIVGTLGDKRAGRMVETVLAGAYERRARAVIVDITGLRQVDASMTRTLIEMAAALRLLGVSVLLTGVGPEIARTIAQTDANMTGIVIRSTLEAGIAFAMGQRA